MSRTQTKFPVSFELLFTASVGASIDRKRIHGVFQPHPPTAATANGAAVGVAVVDALS